MSKVQDGVYRLGSDWDPWSAAATNDPPAAQADLRKRCPIAYTAQVDGFWSITKYDDIVQAANDTDHFKNYLIDNDSCILVGVQATGARLSEESRAAEDMIARFTKWQGRKPESIAADASYENGEFLAVAGGPGDQAVHAHQGCCRANEKYLVWSGVLYLPAGEQQLRLPCRQAVELWRTQREKSHLRLHRNPQEVRSMRTEIPMHNWTVPVSCNPHE